jgi:2-oxoglutarate dehydrogenase E1 component
MPTTPANYFHVLRRQQHRVRTYTVMFVRDLVHRVIAPQHFRKPLVVMTPKNMLRNRLATSSPADFVGTHYFKQVCAMCRDRSCVTWRVVNVFA